MKVNKKEIYISLSIIIVALIIGTIGFNVAMKIEKNRTRKSGGSTLCNKEYCYIGYENNPTIMLKINNDHILEITAYEKVIYFSIKIDLLDATDKTITTKFIETKKLEIGSYRQFDLKLGLTDIEVVSIDHYGMGWHNITVYDKWYNIDTIFVLSNYNKINLSYNANFNS